MEPITPPLSPLKNIHLFEPTLSDPAFDIPLLSDPDTFLEKDLEDIENELFRQDALPPTRQSEPCNEDILSTSGQGSVNGGTPTCSSIASLDELMAGHFPKSGQVRRESMKVEETILPFEKPQFPEMVDLKSIKETFTLIEGSPTYGELEHSELKTLLDEANKEAIRMSEHETLVPADTLARVDVPFLDCSLPNPPWNEFRSIKDPNQLVTMQQVFIEKMAARSIPMWRPDKDFKLVWNPFPSNFLAEAMAETFEPGECDWQAFFEPEDDNIIDISDLTWKPPGLKVLSKADDSDDEIENANFDTNGELQDLSFLVKKRKFENDDGGQDFQTTHDTTSGPGDAKQNTTKTAKGKVNATVRVNELKKSQNMDGVLIGDNFSLSHSIDTFLEIRGIEKSKLRTETCPTHTIKLPENGRVKHHQILVPIEGEIAPSSEKKVLLVPPPALTESVSINVVFDSSLLKRRDLLKEIERLIPQVMVTERDFSAYNMSSWMPGSVARLPKVSPLAYEADIIASPTVGIIFTTVQMIKQKPLPGQKKKVAIRDRLEKVSERYVKLIVLVTEDAKSESSRQLDVSDSIAMSELIAFTSTLPADVLVQLLSGGTAPLANWISHTLTVHRVEESLLPDETYWELFLRRIGLNAFAAQAIIARLKCPHGVDPRADSKDGLFGLTGFVGMGREKRIAQFAPLCGHRLISNASSVIDEIWK